MADESLQNILPTVEADSVPPATPEQIAATRKETENFLAVLAMNDANFIMRNQTSQEDSELILNVVDNYIANIRRSTEGYNPEERLALVLRLSSLALKGVPLGYADLFKSRMSAFIGEQPMPKEMKDIVLSLESEDELEGMVENVTDETASPPRGMAIEKLRAAIQNASAKLMGIVSQ